MTENPLPCTINNCEMAFSNKEHLEWHQKKHDMMLNLELSSKSIETDQTPTPTRFIRNCEEVGLFQDLQNVNPFDEVFKKAVQNPTSVPLQFPESISDDTLHTPQIYPQFEDNPEANLNSTENTTKKNSNDYALNNVNPVFDIDPDDADNRLVIVLDSENEKEVHEKRNKNTTSKPEFKQENIIKSMKEKVKHAIRKKTQKKSYSVVTTFPDRQLDENKTLFFFDIKNSYSHEPLNETKTQNIEESSPKVLETQKQVQDNAESSEMVRQREANRAAQTRCRKRKQREFEEMKSELEQLRRDKVRLMGINLFLMNSVKRLEAELKEAKSSNSNDVSSTTLDIAPTSSASTSPQQSTELQPANPHKINNQQEQIQKPPDLNSSYCVPTQSIQSDPNSTVVVIVSPGKPPPGVVVPALNYVPINVVFPQGEDDLVKKTCFKKIIPKCSQPQKNDVPKM